MTTRNKMLLIALILTLIGSATLIYFAINPYYTETVVNVSKTETLYAGVLYATNIEIPAGQYFWGTFSYSPVQTYAQGTAFVGYELWITNDTGFAQTKNQPGQEYIPYPSVYHVSPSTNFQGNYVIFANNQTMVFPYRILSNESSRYYFVLELGGGYPEPNVTIHAYTFTENTVTPTVVGVAILALAAVFWVIAGWEVRKTRTLLTDTGQRVFER